MREARTLKARVAMVADTQLRAHLKTAGSARGAARVTATSAANPRHGHHDGIHLA
jgi:hypothetical protein